MKKRYCAFFDVDGTVLNTRSMFNFVDFVSEQEFFANAVFRTYYRKLHQMVFSQAQRSSINRFYYSFLKGHSKTFIASLGEEWFSSVSSSGGLYNDDVLSELTSHKNAGAKIVFVTGSFVQILNPLIKELEIDVALCTTPEMEDGVFTGEIIGLPCIGEGKVAAIQRYARENAVDLKGCVAYGDDQTDLPMLNTVGEGRFVEASKRYKDELEVLFTRINKY